jgi:hypothetical protein
MKNGDVKQSGKYVYPSPLSLFLISLPHPRTTISLQNKSYCLLIFHFRKGGTPTKRGTKTEKAEDEELLKETADDVKDSKLTYLTATPPCIFILYLTPILSNCIKTMKIVK